MLTGAPLFAQDSIVVGVVTDGSLDRMGKQQRTFVDELLALTGREFNVQIKEFSGDWSRQKMLAAIDAVYADESVDFVLMTGFVSNQLAATRQSFPKPTFLPAILDTGLLPNPPIDGRSGIENLNYLAAYADFGEDLDTLARITPFTNLALVIDENLASAIPELRQSALEVANARGIELTQVIHDGVNHDLTERIPPGTDAIFVAALPRMPEESFEALVTAINVAKIPSYSFAAVADVERGLLATNTEPRDIDRQARLNALNMQAVMLGEAAEDQPVASSVKDKLTINMATARMIGLSPSFQVLNEAVLLNQDAQVYGQRFDLVEVATTALERNQDLQAARFGLLASENEINRARSGLFPQVGVSGSYTTRNDSPAVILGLFPEQTADLAVSLDQLIYSDPVAAGVTIQTELQASREAELHELRLDVVQAATTAYYLVLNAESQLRIQENNLRISRTNLELAQNRVTLGISTMSDVYRWEAEVARAQIVVVSARSDLRQSWETLNRILHRPLGTRAVLEEASFDEPFIMTRSEFDDLVRSPADFAKFSTFYITRALSQAPELEQINAQILAKERDVSSKKRAYWLPDFTIGGRYTDNLRQSGVGAGPTAGQGLTDWSVGVQATLPIFSGGLKKANLSRSEYELRQLETARVAAEERVEEEVRIQLHAAQAAYSQIDLSAAAAASSRKNFELVSDAYARGTVNVIELLDAQDTSLAATASAEASLYNFLITIMSLQRAVGGYDYLLSPEERSELAAQFRAVLTQESP
jgi:outer membrane protein TolC